MIFKFTKYGTDYYVDSDIIQYGYDNSGLELVLSNNNTAFKPSLQVYKSTSINVAELPTYATFVTDTADFYFLEMVHTVWGFVNVNLLSIERLELIDSSNTKVYFNATDYVEVNVGIATIQTAINTALTPPRYADEDIVSDGSGVVTLANNYISGTWSFYLRGTLVRKSDVSETGANELTTSLFTRSGDFINVKYQY